MPIFDLTGAVVPALCAGAVRQGVQACAEAYQAYNGARVEARFATAPQIAAAMESGRPGAQVLIVPTAALIDYMRRGLVARKPQHSVGTVRAGVVVPAAVPPPRIDTAAALRAALLRADQVIFNRSSSGSRVQALLDRLDAAAALAGRLKPVEDGAAVVEAVAASTGNAIGIAQSTEIRRVIALGARAVYAGPLPGGAAIETDYMAGLVSGTQNRPARFFVRFLGSRPARDLMAANGVEPLIAVA